MRFLTAFLLALTLLTTGACAQSLAACLPADTLAYFRQNDPLGGFQKFAGNTMLWSSPMDTSAVLDQMDEGLGMLDQMLGVELGSLSTMVKSIQTMEGAVIKFEMTDGAPVFDFVFVITTPQAQKIYDLASGKFIAEQLGTKIDDSETEVGMEEFSMNIGIRGDQLIIASSSSRLRDTMKTYGSVVAGCLSQSGQFQAAVKNDGAATCLYIRLDAVLKILRDEGVFNMIGRGGMRGSGDFGPGGEGPRGMRGAMVMKVLENLGVFQLQTLGWIEEDAYSRASLIAQGPIPLFDIFASEQGAPELMGMLPADTAFAFTWHGELGTLWKKAAPLLLDQKKNPMAMFLTEGIAQFQREVGLKIEEVVALHKNGFIFALLPDENGNLKPDRGEGLLFMMRITDKALVRDTLTKLMEVRAKRQGGESGVTVREEGDSVFFDFTSGDNELKKNVLVLTGDWLAFGQEANLRKVVLLSKGQYPSLATTGALKGLKANSTAYMYLGLKTIFGLDNDFGPAYAAIKDSASISASFTVTPESGVFQSSPSVSYAINAFAGASAMYEKQREERQLALKDLGIIATAYREFRGLQGKNPTSMDQLKLPEGKSVAFPPTRPGGVSGRAYELVPACEPSDTMQESQIIVATAPDTSLGRLVVTLNGNTGAWSEARYRAQVAKQAKALQAK